MFTEFLFFKSMLSRPKGLDDIPDWAPADGAEPLASALPLLEGALVTHAHVAAGVEDAVNHVFVADGALAGAVGPE